jgi:hypothetical protein
MGYTPPNATAQGTSNSFQKGFGGDAIGGGFVNSSPSAPAQVATGGGLGDVVSGAIGAAGDVVTSVVSSLGDLVHFL